MLISADNTTKARLEVLLKPLSWLRYKIGTARYNRRYRNFRPSSSGDAVVLGIARNVAYLAALLERGNLEMFLKRLAELNTKLLSEPLWGRALFVPELDELARRASLILAPSPNPPTNSKLLVYIATEIYATGGHTRVIEDIAAMLPAYRHVLIVTAMHRPHPPLALLKPRFEELNLHTHLLQGLSRAEKARELSSLIAALGPQAILLLAHPDDSIANAGVAGHSAPRVLLLHHSDHQPSLGASRTDYTHVDLTTACHRFCASRPEPRASLLNLTVKDVGTVRFVDRDSTIGVTCGAPHKYTGSNEFSYAELLAALFAAGVDQILHIGDMPEEQKDLIRTEIVANGQNPGRIVFLPNTTSLTEKLLEISPDFYVVSHPIVGGKATVEALSVGLPILHARPASAPPLLSVDMTFGTSVTVSTLEQIPVAVHRLDKEKRVLAKQSRAIYENHYSPAAFREGLLLALNPSPLTCAMPSQTPPVVLR